MLSVKLSDHRIMYENSLAFRTKSLPDFMLKCDKMIQSNNAVHSLFLGFVPKFELNNSMYSHRVSVNGIICNNPDNLKIHTSTDTITIEICDITQFKIINPFLTWIDSFLQSELGDSGKEYLFRYIKLKLIPNSM